ncbi:DNA recombination protein RmuC [Microbacterium sediminis]|uniref:Recombinase RmuC n=1 Tax=Microbacterium sediminis TaxID=904291 RepID=A0A1B9NG32_9MICO|nr:DNA recombination protein RmuC [Microbacterium sediminis]OCG75504.1 recombinase RmuC [Microbacterium sediminis]QBR73898.1 DNA recombination protein RmuC [Microbacterium sediminis]
MDPLALVLVIVALAAGAAIGWFARAGRAARDEAAHALALEAARAEAERRVIESRASLAERLAAANAELGALHESLARQDAQRREAMERERLDRQEAAERAARESAVLAALTPVQESLRRMQQRVDAMDSARQEQFGQVAEQLRAAQAVDEQLRATTESLAGALRSTTSRGVWGETQLRRIVEAAGLIHRVDFDLQSSISSDAGSGRPDMVVRLPGGTSIAVDAKAPLDAFLDAAAIPETATGDERARRDALMQKHVKAVRAHVDALAKKAYWSGLGSSPEFVVCFIPSESVLSAALSEDPGLLEYAFGKRVALASPVNLWAVLKTVAYSWTQQEVSQEARALFDLGNQLYDRLGSLATHANGMRRAIERTVDAYNQFVGSLESRVLVTARRFPGIDASKLSQTEAPAPLEATPRRLTAPELLGDAPTADETASDRADDAAPIAADLGEVRRRL